LSRNIVGIDKGRAESEEGNSGHGDYGQREVDVNCGRCVTISWTIGILNDATARIMKQSSVDAEWAE